MYAIYCSGLILWIVYGVMSKALPLIVQCTIIFIFAFGILLFKVKQEIIKG
jgi:MtN3 and saliva related transmembrane protein